MQFQSYRHRRGREHKTCPLSADGSLCNRPQRLDAQRRTVVLAHAARAPHCGRSGAGFGSILRVEVIKLYQGSVRPFQRLGKTYELRSGQLYARTIVAFADRR